MIEDAEKLWKMIEAYGDARSSYTAAVFHGGSAEDERESIAEYERLEREIRALLKLDPVP